MLFTCPSRYSSSIGHTGVFSLGGWSPRLHARLLGSGVTQEHHYATRLSVGYRALTVSGAPSQGTSAGFSPRVRGSYNPAWHARRFRQSARSARRYSGPRDFFLFLPVLRCFSSRGSPHARTRDDRARARPGCPIRPSRDHRVCAAPPGLSQLTTAFIASVCPGIPHMPSLA